jgi:hypothetical protein
MTIMRASSLDRLGMRKLSMKAKSSWHRPEETLILSLSKDEAAAAVAGPS